MYTHSITKNKQRGAASILMAVVFLFAITIVSIFTARTTIMEQKVSANEIRTRQAFEAADAGMQHLIAHSQGGVDQVTAGTLDTVFVDVNGDAALTVADDSNTLALTNGSSFNISLAGTLNTAAASTISLTSTGLSDDGLGTRTITQDIIVAPPLGSAPSHPVITQGVMEITGNVTLTNLESNATVWSGGIATISGSGSTVISDGAGGSQVSSDSGVIGADIVDQDPVLATATSDDFFENFFNGTRDYIKSTSDIVTTSAADIEGQFGKKMWVDGDLSYNGDDIGCAVTTSPCPSGVTNQVGGILVVDGNLSVSGNTNFYGMIYVTGDLSIAGTFTVVGAVIVEGAKTGGGTFDVTYDSRLAGGGDGITPNIASTNGTWKDF